MLSLPGVNDNFNSYNCEEWDESGKEIIHKITTNVEGDIVAAITNIEGGDLDVFILMDCEDSQSCVASEDNTATAINQPAGTYSFQNVPPGLYRVVITSLPGPDWYVTLPHQAGAPNDAGEVDNDSDFEQITLESHEIEVLSEETDEEMRIACQCLQKPSY